MSRTYLCVAACLGLCGVAYLLAPGHARARHEAAPVPQQAQRIVPKWEYKVLTEFEINALGIPANPQGGAFAGRPSFADGINGLGNDGWELVAINTAEQPAIYHFKRPK